MTETPLDEYRKALMERVLANMYTDFIAAAVDRGEITLPETETPANRIHRVWGEAIREAPDDIVPWLLGQGDGPVLACYHEALVYEKITYGERQVVECEGVVVC